MPNNNNIIIIKSMGKTNLHIFISDMMMLKKVSEGRLHQIWNSDMEITTV